MLRPDPAQRARLAEIADSLIERGAEALERGWHGAIEGLDISIKAACEKLATLDKLARAGPGPSCSASL
jgi:hypothetical protein